jgi:hypothetical protein
MLFIGLRLYGVLVFVQKEAGIPKKIIKIEDIPGLSKFLNLSCWLYINFFQSFATRGTYFLGIIWYNWKFGIFIMRFVLNVMIIGEAGWAPDQWGHSRFKTLNSSKDSGTNQKHLTAFMRSLLKASPKIYYFSLSFFFFLTGVKKKCISCHKWQPAM